MVQPLRWHSRPATFPLEEVCCSCYPSIHISLSYVVNTKQESGLGEYFFIGYGLKAVICWVHDSPELLFSLLNSDRPPTKAQIDTYRAKFEAGEDEYIQNMLHHFDMS